MTHAGRADAGGGELVVEPRGQNAAQIGANRLVQGREHLQEHEENAHQGQREGQRRAALHSADQHAHGNHEERR